MATTSKNAWKCPECGQRAGTSILLCPCGYHRPTGRKRSPDELETSDLHSPLGVPRTASRAESSGADPAPVWLPRAATLARVLAWVSVVGGVLYAIILASDIAAVGPTRANGPADSIGIGRALASLVAGAVAFIVHQSIAEAIDVLLRLDRKAAASRDVERR